MPQEGSAAWVLLVLQTDDGVLAAVVVGCALALLLLVLIAWCCCRCCFADRGCIHCCARTAPGCALCCYNLSHGKCMRGACCVTEREDGYWREAGIPFEGDRRRDDGDDDSDKRPVAATTLAAVQVREADDEEAEAQGGKTKGNRLSVAPAAYASSVGPFKREDYGPRAVLLSVVAPPGELGAFFVPGSIFVGGFFASSPATRASITVTATNKGNNAQLQLLDLRQGDRVLAVDGIDVDQLRFQEFLHLVYGSRCVDASLPCCCLLVPLVL